MSRRTTKRRRARGTTTVSKVRVLRSLPPCSSARHNVDAPLRPGELFHTLAKFVSIKTVADSPHREDCRQGALFLKRVLRSFGAEASLVPNPIEGKNPIVVATFRANAPPRPNRFEAPRRKRVLCYGHYDVVPASAPEMWRTDPFVMHGKDGWLYGRGVSDNKGPVLAVAAAAAERRRAQEMEVDLVMVIEGEEETGSAGFQEAIRKNRVRRLSAVRPLASPRSEAVLTLLALVQDLIGDIDVILVSNSYWLGETVPCLTFGLRGVIHASVKVRLLPLSHSFCHSLTVTCPADCVVKPRVHPLWHLGRRHLGAAQRPRPCPRQLDGQRRRGAHPWVPRRCEEAPAGRAEAV